MNKQEFLLKLSKGLSGLPREDIEERLVFYGEMIDDRMEEGLSEEDAVREIGNVDEIVSQIIADTPLTKLVKEKMKTKRALRIWEIIFLALGSPIWLSLLIAAFAVVISAYAVLWLVIISLWSVFVSFIGTALGGIVAGIVFAGLGNVLTGIAMIGAGIISAGFSIFSFYGCKAATKGAFLLTKKIVFGIKNCFIKKEEA